MGTDLYEISLGQLAELVEDARLREADPVGGAGVGDLEALKLAVRDLGVEVHYLLKRLESEFDESSDPDMVNACLANHFQHIGREMERIRELRNDRLVF
jgi:hypothetical protein